jgi:hypothetical protein
LSVRWGLAYDKVKRVRKVEKEVAKCKIRKTLQKVLLAIMLECICQREVTISNKDGLILSMIELLATMFGQILRLWLGGTKGAKLRQGLIVDNVA